MKVDRYIVCTLVAVITACGGSGADATGPSSDIAGIYALQTINGAPLPVNIADVGDPPDVFVADTITLRADFTFQEVAMEDVQSGGATVRDTAVNTGTYSHSGSDVTFRDSSGDVVLMGTIQDGALTFGPSTLVIAFLKL